MITQTERGAARGRTLLIVFLLMITGAPAFAQGPNASWVDDAVGDALSAQLIGFGKCGSVSAVDSVATVHFPDVRFFVGRCMAEHGDSLSGLVGIDSLGIIYLLDSPTAFRFLLHRHPLTVTPVDTINYARDALAMTGAIPFAARVIRRTSDLPIGVRQHLEGSTLPQPLTQVVNRGETMTTITVTTFTGSRLTHHYVLLHRSGSIVASHTILWESSSDL